MSFYQMLALLSITTAGPRMLSVLLYERMTLPDWTKRWLQSIPYAVLGALIFPSILDVVPESPVSGLLGGLAAAFLACRKVNVMFVIFGSIAVVFVLQLIGV